MSVITNIFYDKIRLPNEGFLYNDSQSQIQLISEALILELDGNRLQIITLTNQKIEYSLNISYLNSKKLISANSNFGKEDKPEFGNIFNTRIVKMNYLHLINNEEIVILNYDYTKNTDHNLIGIKYQFENLSELFVYSSEPEIDSNRNLLIGRPYTIICLIIRNINDKFLIPNTECEFPKNYKVGNLNDI